MLFLTLMSYVAILIQIIFATVAIASGLYYLAELVEEYSSIAKKCITWINIGVSVLFILFWLLEDFPLLMILCGVLAQISHFVILKSFPYVNFLQPSFIIAVLFIVINHLLAFRHFAEFYFTFSEVLAYFTLCLWLVPFSLFVSLSANDNVLPMTNDKSENDVVTNYFSKKGKRYGLLTFFNYAKESLLPIRTKKGF